MKNPLELISELRNNSKKDDDDPEKLDPLMIAIKSLRTEAGHTGQLAEAELNKRRSDSEKLSRLVTPVKGVAQNVFSIENIPCELVYPKYAHRKDVVILYCHGGGFTNGGLSYARILAAKMTLAVGLEVVTFQYRLAPENPYPAAIEDAMKVWDYLLNKGYGAKNIILMGDSAGGNICLELCLELKKMQRFLPRCMVLMSPWTDMRLTNNSYEIYKDKDPILTYEYVDAVRKQYAGENADFTCDCYSPIMADLSDMPHTLIQVGSHEILRDDSEKLQKKYLKYGSLAKLKVYSRCWHVFQQMPIARATEAIEDVRVFIESELYI